MAIGETPAAFAELNVRNILHNIVVATAGNLIGGSIMVGVVYWFVYLRAVGATVASPAEVDATRQLKIT